MSSVSPFSKNQIDTFFVKNTTRVKDKNKSISVLRDYKILFFACLMWGLPYTPCQLGGHSTEDTACVLLFVSALINVCKTAITIFCVFYTKDLMGNKSLNLTFNAFVSFAQFVSWCLYFNRRSVSEAVSMLSSVMDQVSPRKFKSRWNIYFFATLNFVGCSIVASIMTLNSVQGYETLNVTSMTFFGQEITDEYNSAFRVSLMFTFAFSFINSGVTCSIAVLLASTMYFHLGDVTSNFAMKLAKRFEYQSVSQQTLSENLSMFQRITDVHETVNRAMSTIVLFVYAEIMSGFFIAVCLMRVLSEASTEVEILVLMIFLLALYSFFSVTHTGDRVMRKDQELRERVTNCTRLVIDNGLGDKLIMWFSLMSDELRSASLCVHAGNMFIISNNLALTVTGTMITYGVIIFQMD